MRGLGPCAEEWPPLLGSGEPAGCCCEGLWAFSGVLAFALATALVPCAAGKSTFDQLRHGSKARRSGGRVRPGDEGRWAQPLG